MQNKLETIDLNRRMSVSGSVTRDLTQMTHDPFHEMAMDLAQENLNPAFLRLASSIDEAKMNVDSLAFVAWLDERPVWHEEFFRNLQCMSQTASGEPLLTTWLSADRFWSLLQAGRGEPAVGEIAQHASTWSGLALDEVYFDFHVRGNRAAEFTAEHSAERCTA